MGKGGGSAQTPKLLDDNLKNTQFLKVVDLVSEGQIEGPVNGLNSFMLNGTPVADEQGNVNIHGVEVQWRAGAQSQTPLEGFSDVENEVNVGVQVKNMTPIVRTITAPNIDRLRLTLGVNGLVSQDNKGNQNNTSVSMSIQTNEMGTWVTQKEVTISGKISGPYFESHTINAPAARPFSLRVVRNTPDSPSDLLKNDTAWSSYTEITDVNLSYPNSAVIGMRIDRSMFGDTPTRTYHLRGMVIKVPDNYDPLTRQYNGIWLGNFKTAWTDNPAWIFYDLVTNERYGLGRRLGQFGCDKFTMYAIGQYCDQQVPDGFGGQEPRFTCNAYLTDQRSAYEVLSDLASVFRAMPVWDGLQYTCVQDRPSDKVWTFTNANVVDGKFSRSFASLKARHTAIQVSWINPDNGWKEEVEYVSDDGLVARFGLNASKVTAFGCTSRGQANRIGRWLLETERLETETITFSTGAEGIVCMPGDIIEVADNDYAAARVGGRVVSFEGNNVTLDAPVDIKSGEQAWFSYLGPAGAFVKLAINAQLSTDTIVLASPPTGLKKWGVFSVSTSSLFTRLYRVMAISEDNKEGTYAFTALQHEPQKEAIVDRGANFEGLPTTNNTVRVPAIEHLTIIPVNDSTLAQARAMWDTATVNRNITFDVRVYRDGRVVSRDNTADFEFYFNGLDVGDYSVGVRGRDQNGMLGEETQVSLIIGAPPAPTYVRWIPGVFQANLIPAMPLSLTSDTNFEFWFAGETPIANINNVETQAQYLGRGYQWTIGQLKVDHTYYVYVRTRNSFGTSGFVQVSGKPEENFGEITDQILKEIEGSDLFKQLIEGVADGGEKITELAAAITDNAEKLAAAVGSNKQTAEAIINNSLAIADVVVRQTAQNGVNTAKFEQLREVMATETDARVTDVIRLEAKTSQNDAGITEVRQALATETQTRAASVDQLNAKTAKNEANVTNLTQTVTTLDSAMSSRLEELSAQSDRANGGVQNNAIALIDNALAQANLRTTLTAQYGDSKAGIERIDSVIASEKEATAQSLQQIRTDVAGNAASITNLSQTVSNYQQSSATQINTLNATVNGHTAAISINAQAAADIKGNLNAMYNIKVGIDSNGRQYAAGMGIGVENTPGGMQSQVIFLADRFAVMSQENGDVSLPFVIQNGQTFIRDAFIRDGTITNAKIANASIDMAKISGELQSDNWDGFNGWYLPKDGGFQIGGSGTQGRSKLDGSGLAIYTPQGILVAKLGWL